MEVTVIAGHAKGASRFGNKSGNRHLKDSLEIFVSRDKLRGRGIYIREREDFLLHVKAVRDDPY